MNGDLQQNLHGAGSQLRKRKIEPIETIDLSISSSDEDVISHSIRSGNKIRKVDFNPVSEATNTISFGNNNNDDRKDISSDSSNNNILRDSKRSTQSTGMVETDTGFTRVYNKTKIVVRCQWIAVIISKRVRFMNLQKII